MPTGRKPKAAGTAQNKTRKYEWKHADGVGWQHGDPHDGRRKFPTPPPDLLPVSVEAWDLWLRSDVAAYWLPADLPGLRALIKIYDKVYRHELGPEKLVPLMDRYGLTEKGRVDNRWAGPKPAAAPPPSAAPADDEVAKRRKARAARVS
jgi:hypothetical protein